MKIEEQIQTVQILLGATEILIDNDPHIKAAISHKVKDGQKLLEYLKSKK